MHQLMNTIVILNTTKEKMKRHKRILRQMKRSGKQVIVSSQRTNLHLAKRVIKVKRALASLPQKIDPKPQMNKRKVL